MIMLCSCVDRGDSLTLTPPGPCSGLVGCCVWDITHLGMVTADEVTQGIIATISHMGGKLTRYREGQQATFVIVAILVEVYGKTYTRNTFPFRQTLPESRFLSMLLPAGTQPASGPTWLTLEMLVDSALLRFADQVS